MEIINSHAHIYPDKIAGRATQAIGDFYDIEMDMPLGTSDALIKEGKEAGITRFVVHSVATKPEQVRSINDFIYSETLKHSEFIGFMTLHPEMSENDIIREVERCVSKGFYGLKLHPDFQKFNIDGEQADKIYRAISMVNKVFPILFHTGDNRYEYSKPFRLASVAKKYPSLTFIGAHFGGYRCWDDYKVYEGLDNVYFDTSSSLPFISKEKAVDLIRFFGYKKFFFGDDFPMWSARKELERFLSLGLSKEENEAILSGNFKKLLGL